MTRSLVFAWLTALLAWLGASPAFAQEAATRRVEGRVTVVSGSSVYLDIGNDAGLEPGDRGRALPVSGSPVELIVRSVSRQSARCEIVGEPVALEVGAPVEFLLPATRTAAPGAAEHPPWTQPTENWQSDIPLLAPARSLTPAERERKWFGRWYTGFDGTYDHAGDAQTYTLARAGVDMTVDNAFGHGDSVNFDGELWHRTNDDSNSTDDVETRFRVDRLSWSVGDSRDSNQRFELGRFLHSELPQLGLIDGVEWVRRTESGDRWGASVGAQPEWTAEMSSGDDLATSLFYRHIGGDKGQFSAAGAFQKTWHKGEADRDLALGDLSWRPSEKWWLYASAWVDWYDSSDTPKSSGFELTELHLSASYRPDKSSSVGVTASQMRWPFLLKNELPPTTLDSLTDGVVERAGLNGWRDLTKRLRLYGRLDRWTSDSDTGLGGELRVSFRDLLFEGGNVSAAVYANDGEYTQVEGLRLSAYRSTSHGTWTVGYDIADYQQSTGNGVDTTLTQQALRGSWDTSFGEAWSLSLSLDARFGDEQDSQSFGFWLQRRF